MLYPDQCSTPASAGVTQKGVFLPVAVGGRDDGPCPPRSRWSARVGGAALPNAPTGRGMGKPGFPIPLRGGAWGNPVSPHPSPRAYVHVSRLCGCAAHRRNEKEVVPGRAAPSQTLPRGGEWEDRVSPFPCGAGTWGNPVSPHPSPRDYVHVRAHLSTPIGQPLMLRSVWQVDTGTDVPRFITAYPD